MTRIVGDISPPEQFDRRTWIKICADTRNYRAAYWRDLRRRDRRLALVMWRAYREYRADLAKRFFNNGNTVAQQHRLV